MIEKLQALVEEQTGELVQVTRETVLLTDLGLSSFDLVQLACRVEDEFSIEIPDKELKNLQTVGDVMDFIEKAQQTK